MYKWALEFGLGVAIKLKILKSGRSPMSAMTVNQTLNNKNSLVVGEW
jgi:hypothetical protein